MRPTKLAVGQKFGYITLIEKLPEKNKHGAVYWLCSCVCGNQKKVSSGKVRQGCSCGCVQQKQLESTSLVGMRFGRLIVKQRLNESDKFRSRYYLCECDCGKTKKLSSHNLKKTGGSSSCGCLAKELGLSKLPYGQSSFNQLLARYVFGAAKRKVSFDLTKEEFIELVSSDCHYCGVAPYQIITGKGLNGEFVYNGVDRLNSKLGYTPKNCVPCCGMCNKMKLDTDFEVFVKQIFVMHEHLKKSLEI